MHAPAPNQLWVSDFTYVATWTGLLLWAVPPALPPPMLYVAPSTAALRTGFVIDVFARYIVGWQVSRTAHTSFVQDTLEQAIHERKPAQSDGLVHHSNRGSSQIYADCVNLPAISVDHLHRAVSGSRHRTLCRQRWRQCSLSQRRPGTICSPRRSSEHRPCGGHGERQSLYKAEVIHQRGRSRQWNMPP
jgi:transposase InsO family protein